MVNNTISLLPSNNENQLMLTMIDEAMRLFGFQCLLIDYKDINMYLDDQTLSNAFDYRILLQEYIDKKILANLSWQHIEKQQQGQVAFAPIQWGGRHFSVVEHMVIKLFNGDLWEVAEVNRTYLVGLWYVVRLVPYVPEKDRPREEKQMKSNYFDPLRQEVF
jgi:hypothetical protein